MYLLLHNMGKVVKVVFVSHEQTLVVDCYEARYTCIAEIEKGCDKPNVKKGLEKPMLKKATQQNGKGKLVKKKETHNASIAETKKKGCNIREKPMSKKAIQPKGKRKIAKKKETFHDKIRNYPILYEKNIIIEGTSVLIRMRTKGIFAQNKVNEKSSNKTTTKTPAKKPTKAVKIPKVYENKENAYANRKTLIKDVSVAAGKPSELIFQLKVVLLPASKPTWRRLQIRGRNTFLDLHLVIQKLMCWGNLQKHLFMAENPRTKKDNIIVSAEDLGNKSYKFPIDEEKAIIADYFPNKKPVIYFYNLTDKWVIDIRLENVLPPDDFQKAISGIGECPPDSFGGPMEYSKSSMELFKLNENISRCMNEKENYYLCVQTENEYNFEIIPRQNLSSQSLGRDMPTL